MIGSSYLSQNGSYGSPIALAPPAASQFSAGSSQAGWDAPTDIFQASSNSSDWTPPSSKAMCRLAAISRPQPQSSGGLLGDIGHGLSGLAGQAGQDLSGLAHQAGQGISGLAQQAGQGISGLAHQAGHGISGLAQQAGQGISGLAHQAGQGISGLAQQAGQGISGLAQQAGKGISGLAKQVGQDGSNWIHDASKWGREQEFTVSKAANQVKSDLLGPPADAPLSSQSQALLAQQGVKSASQVKDPGTRSQIAWNALTTNMGGSSNLQDGKGKGPASAWGYGQAMMAAADQAKLTGNYKDFNNLAQGLKKYAVPGGGFAPSTNGVQGQGSRFYDDNAWIGLAFMQAEKQVTDPKQKQEYLGQAKGVFNFLKTGQQPNGGLIWEENNPHPSFNTCAEGPATELALQLHMATSSNIHDTNDQYFKFASQVYNNMQSDLLIKSGPKAGMYADSVRVNDPSQQHQHIYSYNQGTPVGAGVLFYQITGDKSYLQQAQQTAQASMNYFSQGDKLWKQPPAFNAIYMRNLAQLDAVSPTPEYHQLLNNYTDRVWNQSLNPNSGLFDQVPSDPMGHYGGAPGNISTLDQSALVQMLSLGAFNGSSEAGLT